MKGRSRAFPLSFVVAMAFVFVSYSNCSEPLPAPTEDASLAALCEMGSEGLFGATYHPLLKRQCVGCHVTGPGIGSFASSDLPVAHQWFTSLGRAKIEQMAMNDSHKPPFTGAHLKAEVEAIRGYYAQGEKDLAMCGNGSGQVPPVNILSLPRLLNATNSYKNFSWDLEQDLNSEDEIPMEATFTVRIRRAVLSGKVIGYEFQNPTLTIKQDGRGVRLEGFRIWINDAPMETFTTYQNRTVSLSPGSSQNFQMSGTNVFIYSELDAEDLMAFEFLGVTFDGDGAGGGGGGGGTGPVEPGTATFQSLVAAGGVFQKACVSCHNSTTQSGGLNITNYNRVMSDIISGDPDGSYLFRRMTDSQAPMPPAGVLAPADLQVVEDWIRRGAPQQ